MAEAEIQIVRGLGAPKSPERQAQINKRLGSVSPQGRANIIEDLGDTRSGDSVLNVIRDHEEGPPLL